jgi:hypothetical protein
LIPLIKSEGIGAFKLQVIPLIEFYSVNQELSLEQYFLLHPEYNLNVLKVVNDFSGAFVGVRLERSVYNVFSGYTSNIQKKSLYAPTPEGAGGGRGRGVKRVSGGKRLCKGANLILQRP